MPGDVGEEEDGEGVDDVDLEDSSPLGRTLRVIGIIVGFAAAYWVVISTRSCM